MGFFDALKNLFSNDDLSSKKIAILLKGRDDYWTEIERGIKKAAENYDVQYEIFWSKSEKDIQGRFLKLISILEDEFDGIILPLNYQFLDILDQAYKNGKKIIAIDSPLVSLKYTSIVATDNYKAGVEIAHMAAKAMKKTGKTVCLDISENTASVHERIQGYTNTMIKSYPNIELLPTIDHFGEVDLAYDMVEQLVEKHPDIKTIFSANYHGTIATARFLKDSRCKSIDLLGFDATPEIIQYYKEGLIKSLTVQFPFDMGYQAVKQMKKALQNNHPKKYVDTGTYSISADNDYSEAAKKILEKAFIY